MHSVQNVAQFWQRLTVLTYSVNYDIKQKNRKSSHFRSWNQVMFGIFCLKNIQYTVVIDCTTYSLQFLIIYLNFYLTNIVNSSLRKRDITPDALNSFIPGISWNLTYTPLTVSSDFMSQIHPSSHPLRDAGDSLAVSATGHWPRIPCLSGLSALWLNDEPVTTKAASPRLACSHGEGGGIVGGSLPRGHSDTEKRVCLAAEARSSLDNSHILLKDAEKTRQTAKRVLIKYPLKISINTRGINNVSGPVITKYPEAKSSSKLAKLGETMLEIMIKKNNKLLTAYFDGRQVNKDFISSLSNQNYPVTLEMRVCTTLHDLDTGNTQFEAQMDSESLSCPKLPKMHSWGFSDPIF